MTYRSPFPGMDPFVEWNSTWDGIHGWFIFELASQIIPQARQLGVDVFVERSVYRCVPDSTMKLLGVPDEITFCEPSPSQWTQQETGIDVAIAKPRIERAVVIADDEQASVHKQYSIIVREVTNTVSRDIAVIELLHSANKLGVYAEKYQEKRSQHFASIVHFLEIDLLREGNNPSRDRFPELPRTPYFIFLARKKGLGWNEEGFPVRLQEPLPTIGLPLTADRPILPLNLQAAFESAFNLSAFVSDRLYGELPGPPLASEDQAFVNNILAHRQSIETFD